MLAADNATRNHKYAAPAEKAYVQKRLMLFGFLKGARLIKSNHITHTMFFCCQESVERLEKLTQLHLKIS